MSFDRVERTVASASRSRQARPIAAEQKADITPSAGQAGGARAEQHLHDV